MALESTSDHVEDGILRPNDEERDRLMLGYDAYVYEIEAGVSAEDIGRISFESKEERTNRLNAVIARRLAYVPYRTWVDHLLESASEGRAQLLHDGGYPYVFYATGADIKMSFASSGNEEVANLADATWYLVEAWDQS